MNHTLNDYGKEIIQVGMPGSDEDIKNRYPQALKRISSFYMNYPYAKAYLLIVQYLGRMKVDNFTRKRIAEVLDLHVVYKFNFD